MISETTFDVDWAPETILADQSAVLSDLEDLQPYDGVFRVDSGSSLLDGVEEGSIVVWPQVGIFEILSLDEQGDVVEVETKWARLGAAMDRADISFGHTLEAGEPGRVVGVRSADQGSVEQGVRVQPLSAEAGPVEYSDEGLQYSGSVGQYGIDTNLGISGDTISVGFSTSSGPVTAEVNGQVSGMQAQSANSGFRSKSGLVRLVGQPGVSGRKPRWRRPRRRGALSINGDRPLLHAGLQPLQHNISHAMALGNAVVDAHGIVNAAVEA